MIHLLPFVGFLMQPGHAPVVACDHSKATMDLAFAWERAFMERLQRCIATGDAAPITTLMRPDDICLLFWRDGALAWVPDCAGTVDEVAYQLPQMFDIRCDRPRFTRWREGDYGHLVQEWGGYLLKLTIRYENAPRIDHLVVTTDGTARIKALSMHRDVARYPYYDYDLERLVTE
jgi:hypothetical protein